MAADTEFSATNYIAHHLTHLKGTLFGEMVHVDTLITSLVLGVVGLWLLYSAARKATPGVPGKWQAAIELLVDFVEAAAAEHAEGPIQAWAELREHLLQRRAQGHLRGIVHEPHERAVDVQEQGPLRIVARQRRRRQLVRHPMRRKRPCKSENPV